MRPAKRYALAAIGVVVSAVLVIATITSVKSEKARALVGCSIMQERSLYCHPSLSDPTIDSHRRVDQIALRKDSFRDLKSLEGGGARARSSKKRYRRSRSSSRQKISGGRIHRRHSRHRDRDNSRDKSFRERDESENEQGEEEEITRQYEICKKLAKKLQTEKDDLEIKVATLEQKVRLEHNERRYDLNKLDVEKMYWSERISQTEERIENAKLWLRRCRGLDIDEMRSPEEVDEIFQKIDHAVRIVWDKLYARVQSLDNRLERREAEVGGRDQVPPPTEHLREADMKDAETGIWPPGPPPKSAHQKSQKTYPNMDDDDEEPPAPPPLHALSNEEDNDHADENRAFATHMDDGVNNHSNG
eukprot:jgi/Bigna1/72272/fgenesh1_pg.19_\